MACATCGDRMERATALLSTKGDPVCRTCDALERVATSTTRAANSALYSALGALALGVLSVPCNVFFLLSFAAILGGIVSLRLSARPEFRATLGNRYSLTVVAAIVAIVTGAVQPILWLFVLFFVK